MIYKCEKIKRDFIVFFNFDFSHQIKYELKTFQIR